MKTSKFFKDCGLCEGTGQHGYNDSIDQHPSWDVTWNCTNCDDGRVVDQDEVDAAIYAADEMIEGMIVRIRITSDNIMLCAKLDCHNLVKKYKNRLHTQARALARLETYKANLQNL